MSDTLIKWASFVILRYLINFPNVVNKSRALFWDEMYAVSGVPALPVKLKS